MRPLVSVLTPSFNQARWVGDNLRSVAVQTYPNIEHIVMDGGSTDGSVEILQSMARPALSWRSEPDRGQSHALNKAFAESRGEIIGWLNSDDAYFAPTVVDAAVTLMQARPECDVVYGHAALVNADGQVLHMMWAPPFRRSLLPLYNFITQPTAFIRRGAIADGFVDEEFQHVMDRELWLRLARRHRFARLDRVVAIDRHQAGRKGYVQTDVADRETRQLAKYYGIPYGRAADGRRKLLKIVVRWRGVGLIDQAEPPHAFGAIYDGRLRLLLRQTVVLRRWMPTSVDGL